MASFQDTLFEFFGRYDKLIDSYKDVDGKGIEERFQGVIGQSIDDELMTLIDNFLPNTIEAQTAFERLLPLAERMLGYDTKNQTLQLGTTVDWHRRILAHMVKYYAIKGTLRSYELLFGIMGLTVEISETWPNQIFDSTDPDIGLDSDERPVLDLGPCEPCSPYTLTVTGTLEFAEIQAGFESIILFNEPINAQGTYTYNGQQVIIPDGLIGDPCPIPEIFVTSYTDEDTPDGQFMAAIVVSPSQPFGWTLGDITYTADDGDPVVVDFVDSYALVGPFDDGTVIHFQVVNATRPECISTYLVDTADPTPDCPIPDMTLIVDYPYLSAEVTNGNGLVPSELRWTVNNGPAYVMPYTSGPVELGPFNFGDQVKLWVDSEDNEACNYYAGLFSIVAPCDQPGGTYVYAGAFTHYHVYTNSGYVSLYSTGEYTVPSGTDNFIQGVGLCVFPSDVDGNITGAITRIVANASNNAPSHTYDLSRLTGLCTEVNIDLLGGYLSGTLDTSNLGGVVTFVLAGCTANAEGMDFSTMVNMVSCTLNRSNFVHPDLTASLGLHVFSSLLCPNFTGVNLPASVTTISFSQCLSYITSDISGISALTGINYNGCTNLATIDAHGLIHITAFTIATCSSLNNLNMSGCHLAQTLLNTLLVTLDGLGRTDVVADFSGGTTPHPTGTGLTAYLSLLAKGCTITVNP